MASQTSGTPSGPGATLLMPGIVADFYRIVSVSSLHPASHARHGAAIAFRRAACACFSRRKELFARRRRRRAVVVELAREGRRKAAIGESFDVENDDSSRGFGADLVAHLHGMARLDDDTIHTDRSVGARDARQRPRLENARGAEPTV